MIFLKVYISQNREKNCRREDKELIVHKISLIGYMRVNSQKQ